MLINILKLLYIFAKRRGIDLNLPKNRFYGPLTGKTRKEPCHEQRPNRFFPSDRFPPEEKISPMCNRYKGDYRIRSFTCYDQLLCMAFAQLTYRESLRDIECCLRAMQGRLYHMGIRGKVARSTLADANETRDWRIYSDFAQILIICAGESLRISGRSSVVTWAVRNFSSMSIVLWFILYLRYV
jgi:hypothetical protein